MRGERSKYPDHSAAIRRDRRWKGLRWEILRRDKFRCVKCGARGRLECDHIQPVRFRPDLAYEPTNLQMLCTPCHSAKTATETGLRGVQSPEAEKWASLLRGPI